MRKALLVLLIVFCSIVLAACDSAEPTNIPEISDTVEPTDALTEPEPTESPELVEGTILIQAVVAGISGNNNYDAIMLVNTGDTVLNLEGMKLVYRLKDDSERVKLIQWETPTYIAPHGYYLLGKLDEDIGITPDEIFEQPIAGSKGGLKLYDADTNVIDALGWGDEAPEGFFEGTPADPIMKDQMLVRTGNDTNDNSTDFEIQSDVMLSNTYNLDFLGNAFFIFVDINVPENLTPGEEFILEVGVTTVSETRVTFPLPANLELLTAPDGFELIDGMISGTINEPGDTLDFLFKAPWTYTSILHHSIQISLEGSNEILFAPPIWSEVSGGSIPISTAKTLVGEEIIVEGTVIMQSGTVYAGGGNTKFYIQDETGGIQVWVDNGDGEIDIPLGAYVRAKGPLLVYLGSFEHAPKIEDVEILEYPSAGSEWPPAEVTIEQVRTEIESLAGSLVTVSGLAARVEEMTYGYEIDLMAEDGQMANIYIDKTGGEMNIETIESGKQYQITALAEIYGAGLRLYPRIQEDIVELYPPVVLMDVTASQTLADDGSLYVSFDVYNHTLEDIFDLTIELPIPEGGVELDSQNNVELTDTLIKAFIPKINGNGGSVNITLTGKVQTKAEFTVLEDYSLMYRDEKISGQPLYVFTNPVLPIWALQGAGFKSPYVSQQVQTTGVVTGVFPELEGFFIQELLTDDDPATSSAIFIHIGEDVSIPVEEYDMIVVSGLLKEAFQQTSIYVDDPITDIENFGPYTGLIAPVVLDPPAGEEESARYFEALESMLVVVIEGLAVAPTNRYGEFALVLPYHDITRLYHGGENGMSIMVDDGAQDAHDDQTNLDFVVATGDTVSNLVGPLAYTYGNYKIEPLYAPDIEPSGNPLPTLEPAEEEQISLMTWNVENLFDVKDPHPSSPERPSYKEYHRAVAKVAATIASAGYPTVIGIQEIENIDILEDIAELLLADGYTYEPVLIEGGDSRGIDVAYLVDTAEAQIVNVTQYPAGEGLTSRHPLLLEIAVAGSDEHIYILNNHFLSMSGGEAATEPRRTAQAAWNVEIMEMVLADDPDAQIVVMGDLNSYYQSLPIDTLLAAGLEHVFDLLGAEERYTYIYQGVSQTLDHILMTSNLFEQIISVEVLHTNADFPPGAFEDQGPQRKSDHDPVVVIIQLSE